MSLNNHHRVGLVQNICFVGEHAYWNMAVLAILVVGVAWNKIAFNSIIEFN